MIHYLSSISRVNITQVASNRKPSKENQSHIYQRQFSWSNIRGNSFKILPFNKGPAATAHWSHTSSGGASKNFPPPFHCKPRVSQSQIYWIHSASQVVHDDTFPVTRRDRGRALKATPVTAVIHMFWHPSFTSHGHFHLESGMHCFFFYFSKTSWSTSKYASQNHGNVGQAKCISLIHTSAVLFGVRHFLRVSLLTLYAR